MRTLALTLFLVLTIGLTAAAAADSKIAFVDMRGVMTKCEAGKKAFSKLDAQFKTIKGDLEGQQKTLMGMREDIQKQSLALSQEAKKDKQTQYQKKLAEYQQSYQKYQGEVRKAEQELSKPLIDKLVSIVQSYGKSHGYTAIYDLQASGVVYRDDSTDLTDLVIKEMNKAMN